MDRDRLRARVSATVRKTSLFRLVDTILQQDTIDRLVDAIVVHLLSEHYSRENSLAFIAETIEDELEQAGIDIEDGDAHGIALAVLFVYEELLENKSDFFDKVQEKNAPIAPIADSDSDSED